MSALTGLRDEVTAELVAAGISTLPYVSETLTPPCAVVVPGQPYVTRPSRTTEGIPFGRQSVRLDVLLVAGKEAAKKVAERIDELIETALTALDDRDVISVSRPGLIALGVSTTPTVSKSSTTAPKFVAAVITIEEVTEA